MKGMFGRLVVTVGMIGLLAGPARAASSIVLPRSGQVGVGVQGQFGTLFKSGSFGREFGAGPGLAVRLKYRMRYERAMGLSFDTQILDSRSRRSDLTAFPASTDGVTRKALVAQTYGFDLYQFFGTRTKVPKYVSASAGILHPYAQLSDGETGYTTSASDGVFVGVGAGLERFVYRSWAVDFATRYQTLIYDGHVNHDVQVSLGMMFYAAQ